MDNHLAIRARAQFSRSSLERTSWNFRARSHPIIVIWPNNGTCTIWCDYVPTSFLARARTIANSQALPGAHRLQFSHATVSNIRHFIQLGYLCDFARSRDSQSCSAHARVRKLPGPPWSAPIGIFAHEHLFSSSFGLIRVPMRFCAIPRWTIF